MKRRAFLRSPLAALPLSAGPATAPVVMPIAQPVRWAKPIVTRRFTEAEVAAFRQMVPWWPL